MYKFYIDLSRFENVKRFVKISTSKTCPVTLKSGRYVVDGKSVLGIYSLDLTRPIELEVGDEDYAAFDMFRINSEV